MEFDTTAFQYAPLPTATSIRLVRIQRGRDAALPTLCGHPLIRLSMQTVDLAAPSVPSYKSLSYTWDSPEPERQKRQLDLSAVRVGAGPDPQGRVGGRARRGCTTPLRTASTRS